MYLNLLLQQNWCQYKRNDTTYSNFFIEYGIPEKFKGDEGPPFTSNKFQTFLTQWGNEWIPSSPHYSQLNGLAESSVNKLKFLVAR